MIFTIGGASNFGMGLIAEGIADVIHGAIKFAEGKGFDWGEYFQNKAISMALSIACAGVMKFAKFAAKYTMKAIKATVKLGKEAWKQGMKASMKAANNALRRAGNALSKAGKAVSEKVQTLADKASTFMKSGGKAKAIGNQVKHFTKTETFFKEGFKEGLLRNGNQIGAALLKEGLVNGATHGVEASCKAAFDELENSIRENVLSMVDEWMATHRSELATLRRQTLSSTAILALIPQTQATFLKENDAVEVILRRFAKQFAGKLSSELGKSKDSKVRAAGLAVTGLIHGSEIAETVAAVSSLTRDWLSSVTKVLREEVAKNESELATSHHTCFTLTQEQIDSMPLSLEELGCERHQGENGTIHIKMVSSNAKETIQKYSSIKSPERFFKKALRDYESAHHASGMGLVDVVSLEGVEGPFKDGLIKLPTSLIRGRLEAQTSRTVGSMMQYGMSKLSEKICETYLDRKAKNLHKKYAESTQDEDIAKYAQKIENFGKDVYILQARREREAKIQGGDAALRADTEAFAMLHNATIVIEKLDGSTEVINPGCSDVAYLVESPGRDGVTHLVPQQGKEYQEPLGAGNLDCMYAAAGYALGLPSSTPQDIQRLRDQVATSLENPRYMMLNHIHRKSREKYGVDPCVEFENRLRADSELSEELKDYLTCLKAPLRLISREEKKVIRNILAQKLMKLGYPQAQSYNSAVPPVSIPIHFSQSQINKTFSAGSEGTGFPLSGRIITEIQREEFDPDRTPLQVFRDRETGQFVSNNNRGLALHARFQSPITNIRYLQTQGSNWKGRAFTQVRPELEKFNRQVILGKPIALDPANLFTRKPNGSPPTTDPF
jgi:hypothetical protein